MEQNYKKLNASGKGGIHGKKMTSVHFNYAKVFCWQGRLFKPQGAQSLSWSMEFFINSSSTCV
ncbi:hypothetical protein CBW16_03850 [Flavobacteriaceae bacterium JJC]|nr:hypothetical protein CBW16_03850 [Flavobacteriaceae bacterium JJC]